MKDCVVSFTVNVPYTHFEKGEKVKISPHCPLVRNCPSYKDKVFTVMDIMIPTKATDYDAFVILNELPQSIPSCELILVDENNLQEKDTKA